MSDYIPKSIDNQNLIAAVAERFEIPRRALLAKRKRTALPVARARQACMYVFREAKGYSSVEIGRILDRDHSTVLYGQSVIEKDPVLRARCDAIAISYQELSEFSDRNFYL